MKKTIVSLVLASLFVSFHATYAQKPTEPKVRVASGELSGLTNADRSVAMFKGIPYAAPPVGDLRWRPPKPVSPWAGVLKADHFGANCMQDEVHELLPWTMEYQPQGPLSEDCLFLNVWTPAASAGRKLPVLFYIHGGAFHGGSGNVPVHDGEALARTGIIVVTINYRLGVLGFFSHPELTAESDHHSSGNYGLLDQMAALEWVKQNIASFGGDPSQVTIAGQSAGAFSVQALITSPLAKGFFRAAIAESGLGVGGRSIPAVKEAEKVGSGVAIAAKAKSLSEMRAVPAKELVRAGLAEKFQSTPVVDGWVLPATPYDLAAQGKDTDVPVLTGWQADDARSMSAPATRAQFEERARQQFGQMADEFLRLYPCSDDQQLRKSESGSARDRERVSMFLWASKRLKNHKGPLFTYFFDRAIPWPQHPEYGAFHSGELPYVFKNLKVMDRPWESVDFKVSDTVSIYWKDFVTASDPNGNELPKWSAVDPTNPTTMRLGAECGPIPVAERAKFDFWVKYFDSEQGKNAGPF